MLSNIIGHSPMFGVPIFFIYVCVVFLRAPPRNSRDHKKISSIVVSMPRIESLAKYIALHVNDVYFQSN